MDSIHPSSAVPEGPVPQTALDEREYALKVSSSAAKENFCCCC